MENNKETKGKKTLTIILIAVILLMATYIVYTKIKPSEVVDSGGKPTFNLGVDKGAQEGKAPTKSKEEIEEELNKKVEESMINISMNMTPVFKDGLSEGNLLIVNEEMNNHMQVVEIYMDDTNELIYTSGGIPVGSRLDTAKLDKNLAKGEYACTAYFNAVNSDTGELIGKAGAQIKIIVQN